jgi:hypothetical protein
VSTAALLSGRLGSTATTRLRPHALYVNLAVRRDYSSSTARALRQPRRAPRVLLRLRRASGCLGMSRGSSCSSSRRSSSTTPGSSSTTSPTPRVRVPRHVARLVTRLLAPLVVDYSASRRLVVVDYFASAARPGASARRVARHAAPRAARRRLLSLRRASGCLGTPRGSSRGSSRCSSSTTSPRAGSSSTTSPSPRVWVPRHVARTVTRLVAWLVAPLVVDYFAYAARPGASARRAARHTAHRRLLRARRDFVLRPHWLYFSHAVRRDYLSRGHTGSTSSMPRAATTSYSGRIASTFHLD